MVILSWISRISTRKTNREFINQCIRLSQLRYHCCRQTVTGRNQWNQSFFSDPEYPPFYNWGLPWHRNAPEDVKPLTPGEPAELVFDLRPVSYVIKAGHRIRVTITAVCGDATPRLDPAPVVTFHRNPIYSSYITLPIKSPIAANVRIEPETLNYHSHGHFTALVQFPKTLDKGYVK